MGGNWHLFSDDAVQIFTVLQKPDARTLLEHVLNTLENSELKDDTFASRARGHGCTVALADWCDLSIRAMRASTEVEAVDSNGAFADIHPPITVVTVDQTLAEFRTNLDAILF